MKIRIIVLFSGGASAPRFLAEYDPNWGHSYEIIGALTNKKNTSGESFFNEKHIPCICCSAKEFCRAQGYTGKLKDMPEELRVKYFEEVLQIMHENSLYPHIILLSGFMLRITPPLLGTYPILNVHPSDLTIVDEKGKRKYIGDNAVVDALKAGEIHTASTIHVVEAEVDCGKIICVSSHLPVIKGESASEHQNRMKVACDGPAYRKALELIATGNFIL